MSEPSASAGGEGYGACDDAVAYGHTFKNQISVRQAHKAGLAHRILK